MVALKDSSPVKVNRFSISIEKTTLIKIQIFDIKLQWIKLRYRDFNSTLY